MQLISLMNRKNERTETKNQKPKTKSKKNKEVIANL